MDRNYTMIELVGTSEVSESEAVRTAVERAAKTLEGLDWFEVLETRGPIKGSSVPEFQVKVRVGLRLMTEGEIRERRDSRS